MRNQEFSIQSMPTVFNSIQYSPNMLQILIEQFNEVVEVCTLMSESGTTTDLARLMVGRSPKGNPAEKNPGLIGIIFFCQAKKRRKKNDHRPASLSSQIPIVGHVKWRHCES
jgi:hypothetical protein